jgi:hypothetical protein
MVSLRTQKWKVHDYSNNYLSRLLLVMQNARGAGCGFSETELLCYRPDRLCLTTVLLRNATITLDLYVV